MPKVSVILPNYNHAPFLKRRIDSILNQTFIDFELILLDDFSQDNSLEILHQYKQHPKVSRLVINSENSGSPFKQWKKGLSLAQGEYIWIAESDDECSNVFLETLLQKFDEFPELGMVYCQSLEILPNNSFAQSWLTWTNTFNENLWEDDFIINGTEIILNYMEEKNVIPNASGVVFKKSLIEFPKQSLLCRLPGDKIIWSTLMKKCKIGFISQELNYFRTSGEKNVRGSIQGDRFFFENLLWLVFLYREQLSLGFNNEKLFAKMISRINHFYYNNKYLNLYWSILTDVSKVNKFLAIKALYISVKSLIKSNLRKFLDALKWKRYI